MDPTQASTTALGTALMRAAHTRLDRPALIDDPWGDRLVSESERTRLLQVGLRSLAPQARARLEALGSEDEVVAALARAHPSYGMVILRMRYAEDVLAAAVERGVRQYVILGAGMDSLALRRPAFADGVVVIEVDHPATQELKLKRLRDCGLETSPSVHYVASDLALEELDSALARAPFDPGETAFFSWLGVTAYLTREANLKTLRAISSSGAPGTELVFSYIDQGDFDDPDQERIQARAVVAALGEPWVSGFHPSALARDLQGVGLTLVEDLGREQLHERYCRDRDDELSASVVDHVAHARVSDGGPGADR